MSDIFGFIIGGITIFIVFEILMWYIWAVGSMAEVWRRSNARWLLRRIMK